MASLGSAFQEHARSLGVLPYIGWMMKRTTVVYVRSIPPGIKKKKKENARRLSELASPRHLSEFFLIFTAYDMNEACRRRLPAVLDPIT